MANLSAEQCHTHVGCNDEDADNVGQGPSGALHCEPGQRFGGVDGHVPCKGDDVEEEDPEHVEGRVVSATVSDSGLLAARAARSAVIVVPTLARG